MKITYYIRKGREGFGQGRMYVAGTKTQNALHVLIRPRVTIDRLDLQALRDLGHTVTEISEPKHDSPR